MFAEKIVTLKEVRHENLGVFSVSIRVNESNHCNSSLSGRANKRDVNIMIVYSLLKKKQKFIKSFKEQRKCESIPVCSIISVVYCK